MQRHPAKGIHRRRRLIKRGHGVYWVIGLSVLVGATGGTALYLRIEQRREHEQLRALQEIFQSHSADFDDLHSKRMAMKALTDRASGHADYSNPFGAPISGADTTEATKRFDHAASLLQAKVVGECIAKQLPMPLIEAEWNERYSRTMVGR